MRALCGAIITAGALIGLGLACVGIGWRYEHVPYKEVAVKDGKEEVHFQYVEFKHLDTALMLGVVVLLVAVVIGLGIAFVGLAYHHHRRHHEFLRDFHNAAGRPADRISV